MFLNNQMEKTYLYTFLNQVWRFISGPIMLICIPLFLTPIQQGYWYTFSSLAALSVFANLGFTLIVQQFSAHEFAFLTIDFENNMIIGDEARKQKLGKFFSFSIKWAISTGGIVYFFVGIFGSYFLSTKNDNIFWQLPWFLYLFSTFIQFVNTTVYSFFEGCNLLYLSQRISLLASIISCIISIITLYLGGGLYALGLSVLFYTLFMLLMLYKKFMPLMKQLFMLSKKSEYNWYPEFCKLLKKYAVTWISSYMLLQTVVPIIFHFFGAVMAGKIGFSVAIFTAVSNFSRVSILAITPQLNMLVAKNKWKKLDKLFKKNFLWSMWGYIICGSCFIVSSFVFSDLFIFKRLVPFMTLCTMFFVWGLQLLFNNLVTYLRAYKIEPLMKGSFINAFFSMILTCICAFYLPIEYIFIGMIFSCLLLDIYTYQIFIKQRRLYICS